MRGLVLLLLALVVLAPAVGADEAKNRYAVGVNLGYVAPGYWHAYYYTVAAPGVSSLDLTWKETGIFPFADFDLHLYRPGSLSDNYLEQHELLAVSAHYPPPTGRQPEHIDIHLAPARYVIAVVPFQAQGEEYTLRADPGTLQFATSLLGFVGYQP